MLADQLQTTMYPSLLPVVPMYNTVVEKAHKSMVHTTILGPDQARQEDRQLFLSCIFLLHD